MLLRSFEVVSTVIATDSYTLRSTYTETGWRYWVKPNCAASARRVGREPGDRVAATCKRVRTRAYAYASRRSPSLQLRSLFPPSSTTMPVAVPKQNNPSGIKAYYQAKIEAAELLINQKTQNLRRLEAQRNALNARGMCSLRIQPDHTRS